MLSLLLLSFKRMRMWLGMRIEIADVVGFKSGNETGTKSFFENSRDISTPSQNARSASSPLNFAIFLLLFLLLIQCVLFLFIHWAYNVSEFRVSQSTPSFLSNYHLSYILYHQIRILDIDTLLEPAGPSGNWLLFYSQC